MKLAKKELSVNAMMSIDEFLEVFNRGLINTLTKINTLPNKEKWHIEDLAYQAEFYAENFASIISSLDWKYNAR